MGAQGFNEIPGPDLIMFQRRTLNHVQAAPQNLTDALLVAPLPELGAVISTYETSAVDPPNPVPVDTWMSHILFVVTASAGPVTSIEFQLFPTTDGNIPLLVPAGGGAAGFVTLPFTSIGLGAGLTGSAIHVIDRPWRRSDLLMGALTRSTIAYQARVQPGGATATVQVHLNNWRGNNFGTNLTPP